MSTSYVVTVIPVAKDSLFIRCGHGDLIHLVRDPNRIRFCQEVAVYEVGALDGFRNVCAEHLTLAVDLGLGQDLAGG